MPRSLKYQPVAPAYGNAGQFACKFAWNSGAGMNTIVDLVALPAYTSITAGGVHILTAFNDSGTDTIDVGFRGGSATDDPDAYATLLTASAVGMIVFDELATTTNIINTKPIIVTARYNAQNSNATAGVALLWFNYATVNLA